MFQLDSYGLSTVRLVAGFWGGLAYALVARTRGASEIVASIVVGTATANYLTDLIAKVSDSLVGAGGTAFIVGLCSMAICRGVLAAAKVWWHVSNGD